MKFLNTLLSICIFCTCTFAQNAFLEKLKQHKTEVKPHLVKAQSGFKVQMVKSESITNIENDSILEFDHEYKYNNKGKQTESTETEYDLGIAFIRTREKFTFENDTQLVREEEFDFNFAFQDFELERYTDYFYSANTLLERSLLFENNAGSFEESQEVLFDYNAKLLLTTETGRNKDNGSFTNAFRNDFTYLSNNKLKSEQNNQCSDTECAPTQLIEFNYNSSGLLDSTFFFVFENGQRTPSGLEVNRFNSNRLFIEQQYLRYNESSQSYEEDERTIVFYNQNSVPDSFYLEVYDFDLNQYVLDAKITELDYNTSVTKSETLLPNEFNQDFLIFDVLFAFQLNSYTIEFGDFENNDTQKDREVFTYSNFTSVTEQENFAFTLSPNPTTDVLNIQLKDGSANKAFVFNNLGQTMLQQNITENNFSVDTKNLKPGVYFVKIVSNNSFLTERFVKQ